MVTADTHYNFNARTEKQKEQNQYCHSPSYYNIFDNKSLLQEIKTFNQTTGMAVSTKIIFFYYCVENICSKTEFYVWRTTTFVAMIKFF